MNRLLKLIGLVIVFALILTEGNVFSQTLELKKCCIGGKYNGTHTEFASKTCPKPETGKFIMEINQEKGCGSKILGKIISPNGSTQDFYGIVTSGLSKCCTITGDVKKPKEETHFKGSLCMQSGKRSGGGDYTNKRESKICQGKWEMTQMQFKLPLTTRP